MTSPRERLHVNRFYQLTARTAPSGKILGLRISAPVPGHGPRSGVIAGAMIEEALDFFRTVHVNRPVAIEEFSPRLVRALRACGVLLRKERLPRQDGTRLRLAGRPRLSGRSKKDLTKSSLEFPREGFAVVRGWMPRKMAHALERAAATRIRNGFVKKGEKGMRNRWVENDDPLSSPFLGQYLKAVSWIAGRPLKPFYTYLSVYGRGCALQRHVDRVGCDITVSITLSKSSEPWPLFLETKGRTRHEINLDAGDAVIFRGRKLPHFRKPFPGPGQHACILLHYICA